MFGNLTYKKKNLFLSIGAVLLLFLVYSLGISKTVKIYYEYVEAKNKMEIAEDAPEMAFKLEKELKRIDGKLGGQNAAGQNTSEMLLSSVTNYCEDHHAILREFPQTTFAKQGDMIIETNQFIVGGSFSTLLKLVYLLEQKNKVGKVASVKYQLKKDFKTKEMMLTASVFIQNIKKQQDEK